MDVMGRVEAGIDRSMGALRRRSAAFDHLWRAGELYTNVLGARLAAAIAYYGFFAAFALALVAYSVFGAILEDNDEVSAAAADFLRENLPFLDPGQIAQSSGTVGVVGLIILVFTGIGWIEAIRSSQRLLYGLNQQPGNLVVRRLVDLVIMIGIFLLLGVSVAAVDALESLLRFLLRSTGSVGLTTVSAVLSVLVNAVLATALLVAVPRLRMSRRRLRPVVVIVAVGITLLNTVGRFYVVRAERNPAYAVVAGAVGLLLYLYLLNQLVLFGAALAATSRHGRVVDLARDPVPADPEEELEQPEPVPVPVGARPPTTGAAPAAAAAATGAAPPIRAIREYSATAAHVRVDDGAVGALVTLDLPGDSPMLGLPWIITFGPLSDEEEWEPVVCGPYEREHALALAEAVVAEEQFMAVVEPLLPAVSAEEIREEITTAQTVAESETARLDEVDLYGDYEDTVDEEQDRLAEEKEATEEERHAEPLTAPSEQELRAGFARIAALLTGKGPQSGPPAAPRG